MIVHLIISLTVVAYNIFRHLYGQLRGVTLLTPFQTNINFEYIKKLMHPLEQTNQQIDKDPKKKQPKNDAPPKSTAPAFDGFWAYATTYYLNNLLARQYCQVDEDQSLPAHGMYLPVKYFYIHMDNLPDLDNGILEIFDERGNFGHFEWDKTTSAWMSRVIEKTFQFDGSPNSSPPKPSSKFTKSASLVLDTYTEQTLPNKGIVDRLYIRSLNDGEVAPQQIITCTPDKKRFTWKLATDTGEGLGFSPVNPISRYPNPTSNFGALFTGNEYCELDFLFYGFNPLGMDAYCLLQGGATGSATGVENTSPQQDSNPGQLLPGALIFEFPTLNSADIVQGPDLELQPWLPLGVAAQVIGSGSGQTHTQMLSSIADVSKSWMSTLGFSAGLEKVMNVAAKSKLSQEDSTSQKHDYRFTLQKEFDENFYCYPHLPTVKLHSEFLKRINESLDQILLSKEPDWDNFVKDYGTHYLHAMTQGKMRYSETRFTLTEEATARTRKVDIKANIGSTFDGGKADGAAGIAREWSTKLGQTVSQEDVTYFQKGYDTKPGVAIFFDLRPLSDLMSPLFFLFDPSSPLGQKAPFVWFKLTESFLSYLNSKGISQAIDPYPPDDYTPQLVTITFPSISITMDDERWMGDNNAMLSAYGSIMFDLNNTEKSRIDTNNQAVVGAVAYDITNQEGEIQIDGSGHQPPSDKFNLIAAVRKGKAIDIYLDFSNFKVATWEGGPSNTYDVNLASFPALHINLVPAIGGVTNTYSIGPVSQNYGLDISYTLHITVQCDIDQWDS